MYETFYEPTEQDLRDYAQHCLEIAEEKSEEKKREEQESEDWPMPPLLTPGRNDGASLDCPY